MRNTLSCIREIFVVVMYSDMTCYTLSCIIKIFVVIIYEDV